MMNRAIQSACEAVAFSYQSFFYDDADECKDEETKAVDATPRGTFCAAESSDGTASPARGLLPAESLAGDDSNDDEEGRRVNAAFSALLREPTPGASHTIPKRPSPGRAITHILHCLQFETWDCGIACLLMVLRWLRDGSIANPRPTTWDKYGGTAGLTERECIQRAWMIDAVDTESIWTIDVVILLANMLGRDTREELDFPGADAGDWGGVSVSYLFCSTELGVDETYNDLGYYQTAFRRDEVRVTRRFQLAKELELPTLCVIKLGLAVVVDIVSRPNCIAVVLLDNGVLLSPIADLKSDATNSDSSRGSQNEGGLQVGVEAEISGNSINLVPADANVLEPQDSGTSPGQKDERSYAGHYIVLCGVSSDPADVAQAESKGEGLGSSFCMVTKNPASKCATDFVTPAHFERAWRANGTDDDIIFITKK